MKMQIREVVVEICDGCGKDSAWHHCIGCAAVFCSDCSKRGIVTELSTSIYHSGRYYVCNKCEQILISTDNEFYNALVKVRSLMREREGFYADFEPRRKEAEEKAEALAKKYDDATRPVFEEQREEFLRKNGRWQ